MTIQEAGQKLTQHLKNIYDAREAGNIADLIMEHLTGLKKIDRVVQKNTLLRGTDAALLDSYLLELMTHKPVQYVLHEAWFFGMRFFVDEHVLIPRPETEELVEWIIGENKISHSISILDVGTGSGCIAVALKKNLSSASVFACDISASALEVAERNARGLGTAVHFLLKNIIDKTTWDSIPSLNIIVSNPPYIPSMERLSMKSNVVGYEPHIALFVEDNDPLIFYKAIAELGKEKLHHEGKIYVEIHEDLGSAISNIFRLAGYRSIEVRKDMQGKNRMIRASRLEK